MQNKYGRDLIEGIIKKGVEDKDFGKNVLENNSFKQKRLRTMRTTKNQLYI